jgi:LruC domain-containing protein
MKRVIFLSCFALAACMTGCIEQKSLYDPDLEPESSYFDFSTTHEVAFSVNYGKMAAGSLLQIFTTNPVEANEDGSFSVVGNADFSIFTDENGCFDGKVELPAGADKVFLVSNSFVAPLCVEVAVNDGSVRFSSSMTKKSATRAGSARVVSAPQYFTVDAAKKIYTLMEVTDKYGHFNDVNSLVTEGNINSALITALQYTLWGNKATKPNNLNNTSLLRGTKYVNTEIAEAYEKADGTRVLVEDADVYFTFVTEAGWNQNVLGYYYYKTGETPSSPDQLKKFVILPNASIDGNVPYVDTPVGKSKAYGYGNAPVTPNTRIQLLFEDANGQLTTKFPAGYTIGYFMIQKGFTEDGKIDVNGTMFYSNSEWNTKFNNRTERFISVAMPDGTVVYGAEDGEDKSYEDVLFTIEANPNEAIQNPERPVIDPTTVEVVATDVTTTTYAFEDVWPHGGDYDLNDVIVEHTRRVSFNQNNYVREVVDAYNSVHLEGAAIFKDAFAVQYDKSQLGTMTCSDGVAEESATGSWIIFSNCLDEINHVRTVNRAFANNVLKKTDLKVSESSLNPFIIVHFSAVGAGNRTEVHLPKMSATSLANRSQIGSESDAYYIDKGGKYPFAISVPGSFTPVTEKVSISDEYPYFNAWVSSNGAQHADWYKYHNKK